MNSIDSVVKIKAVTSIDVGAPKNKPARPDDKVVADSVKISEASTNILGIEQSGIREKFDMAKVESIKAAIARGEFKVDAEKVASGMITSLQNLLK